jgi:NAD(P)-dependent dehydrogenase (short-subunit alcohol dehydrogenase family)
MFQDDLLKDKKVLITGGGTGLGKSMGRRYLELGAELVICGRREEVLAETAAEFDAAYPGKTGRYACDVRDPAAIEAMMEEIWRERPLDLLVNNAAGNFIAKSETLSPRAVDAVLGIVLHGTAYATLACGRRWIEEGRRGNVLSIVTTYAWTGSPYVVPSAMAKAGVLAMTRSLAAEWGGRGVRLNAIAPGPFPTKGAWERLVPGGGFEKAWLNRIPLGRVGEHQELADLAAFLAADQSGYINGEVVTIDGGEWVKGAAQFALLEHLSDEDWAAMRPKKKGG